MTQRAEASRIWLLHSSTYASQDISMTMLKKVPTHAKIIKSSRSENPKFESLEVDLHDLQAAADRYLQSNGQHGGKQPVVYFDRVRYVQACPTRYNWKST